MSIKKYEVKAKSKEGAVVSQQLTGQDQLNRWKALLQANGWRVITTKAL